MSSKTCALTRDEQRIVSALEPRRDAMARDLERLVAIPTGWNHTAGLDECRGLLTDRARALGAEIHEEPGRPAPEWLDRRPAGEPAPIAICRRLRAGAPRALIACHIDTVFDPAGSFCEMTISADGEKAVGPGVVDMKGGILVALNALEALEEAGVDASWTLMLTSDEETGSFSSDHALRQEAQRHDVGIATEPALPGGELAIERLGSGQVSIEAVGRSAHVGRDFESGISAVTALGEALVAIAKMPDPAKGRIISIGPLEGGGATNAVPDRARAWGNMRYPDRQTADELAAMVDALQRNPPPAPAEMAHHHEAPEELEHALPRVIVRRIFNRPAKPLTPEVEALAGAAREAAESLGQRLPFAKTGGVCDGNIMQAAGLPTIDTMGVRGGGLHTPKEWIELSSLLERAQLFALLMGRLTTHGPPWLRAKESRSSQ